MKAWLPVAAALLLPGTAVAQEVADRTPNLNGTWSARPGVVQFNFIHRFDMSDAPLRKITNTPTFQAALGVGASVGVGFAYGSNSDLVRAFPNEWEWFARWSPLSQRSGAPLDAVLHAGWNVAAESVDAELGLARQLGPLRLLGAARAFSHAFYRDSARFALAGGAALRLTPWLSLAADYASLLDRAPGEDAAWGAGAQLSIPHTPHSLSIHASSVGTNTLEGASRGSVTRWGFEYTVPITFARYARRTARAPAASMPVTAGADTVEITIEQLTFGHARIVVRPGTVVVWRNRDPVVHTVTADAGTFESGSIARDDAWSHVFERPGEYAYHCAPHPFMRAVVEVQVQEDPK